MCLVLGSLLLFPLFLGLRHPPLPKRVLGAMAGDSPVWLSSSLLPCPTLSCPLKPSSGPASPGRPPQPSLRGSLGTLWPCPRPSTSVLCLGTGYDPVGRDPRGAASSSLGRAQPGPGNADTIISSSRTRSEHGFQTVGVTVRALVLQTWLKSHSQPAAWMPQARVRISLSLAGALRGAGARPHVLSAQPSPWRTSLS